MSSIIITIVFFALFAGILIYVPRRLSGLFGVEKRLYVYVPMIAATILGAISTGLVSKFSSVTVDYIYLFSSAWLGVFLYLLLFLLVFEIVNLFVKIPPKSAGIAIVLLALLVSVYGIWNAYRFGVQEVVIKVENLPKPVRIAVLADIQIGGHRGKSYLEKIVAQTNELKPDLIVIPGDFADSRAILTEENFGPLKNLQAPAYFTTGNHDTYVQETEVIKLLEPHGIRVLRNETAETFGLQLVGLSYMNADENAFDLHPSANKDTFKSVLPTLPISENLPSILIHHSPVGAVYARQAGIDLFIAGHTHGGGQIFPVTLISEAFFFPYSRGLYEFENMQIYVSQGAGTFGLPMRVGTNNEITLIRLEAR